MTPSFQERVGDLFEKAGNLEADQRLTFLDRACADAPTLRAAVAALLADHDRAEAAGFLDRPACNPLAAVPVEDAVAAPAAVPLRLAGYEVLGELGRGGMGVVYKARQAGLNRDVALKMVLDSDYARPEDLLRFVGEAEMIARVSHPNIVHIYEVGRHEDRPFFAMEYVEGGSLADKLGGTPLPSRAAAELVAVLAQAMQAAHGAGVVHRDLKPSNILLTAGGVPKIMDFGLGKRLEAGGGLTQSGMVMGTPSYMAPEQARGLSRAIGPACDVYALGAVLYECLTGRPPFRAESALETLSPVLHQDPVPPRALQPKVPRDLETICLKCLQKEPTRRYAAAEALAADLHRFLAGAPIQARPIGVWERGVKWARRQPARAALLAVSGAAALIVVAVVLAYNARLRGALIEKEEQRQRAQANFRLARQAVDDYALKVSKDPRLRESLRPLRKELLLTAVPFYEQLVRQRAEDPTMRAELARAYLQLAGITEDIDDPKTALARYEQALALFAQLMQESPGIADYQREWARCQNDRGTLLARSGKPAEAEQAFQAALTRFQELADAHPDVAQFQSDWAVSQLDLATWYFSTERPAEAAQAFQAALARLRGLAGAHPEDTAYQSALALGQNGLGLVYLHGLGKPAEARRALRKALELRKRLADADPENSQYESDLAATYGNMAILHQIAGEGAEAKGALREARTHQARLANRYPEVTHYQNDLGKTLSNLGALYSLTGERRQAEQTLLEAVTIRKRLTERYPEVLEYATGLGASSANLGSVLTDGGQLQKALEWFDQSVQGLEAVVQKEPRQVEAKAYLRNAHQGRAETLSHLGRHAQAVRDWDRALELDDGPNRPPFRLARALAVARAGEHARAVAEANDLAQGKPPPSPDAIYDLACVGSLAVAAAAADGKLLPAERDKLTQQYATQALALLARASEKGLFQNAAQVERLKKDPDLAPLRSRADFQKFLRRLEDRPGRP
jgi:tetratricopeptide (TPR) repeat protein/tRNA A-37 threonylcarbamoyl transferase component Bud32